jgi:hypothetical protein
VAVGEDPRHQLGDVLGGAQVGCVDGCGAAQGPDGLERIGGRLISLDWCQPCLPGSSCI